MFEEIDLKVVCTVLNWIITFSVVIKVIIKQN